MKDKWVEIKQLRDSAIVLASMVSSIEQKQEKISKDLDMFETNKRIKHDLLETEKKSIKIAVDVIEEKLERLQR